MLPPTNLPLPVTSFVGRQAEVADVVRLLTSDGDGACRLLTLTGTGGVGKTRLALQVAATLALRTSGIGATAATMTSATRGITTGAATAVGASRAPGYADGVWLVELAPLAEPAQVLTTVAAVLSIIEQPAVPLATTLVQALQPKRLLLVLDNCEHLLDACAALAEALLRACPSVRLLATSRERLGIAGETTWRVPSLTLPPVPPLSFLSSLAPTSLPAPLSPMPLAPTSTPMPVPRSAPTSVPVMTAKTVAAVSAAAVQEYEAVRLFVNRAQAALPSFQLSDHTAAAVSQICRRLDGMPLAIELAAARVTVLPPEALLARLEDRFRLLTGGSRTALARQQTLRATVDWSYALLSREEQRLFNRLAVFSGGFTLEAAEAVCSSDGLDVWADADAPSAATIFGALTEADASHAASEKRANQAAPSEGLAPLAAELVLDRLSRLVDKSLVIMETPSEGQLQGLARYRLLETLRQYASERLAGTGEAELLHQRHAAYYDRLVEGMPAPFARNRSGDRHWVQRTSLYEMELHNIRQTLRWYVARATAGDTGATQRGMALLVRLGRFWETIGALQEGVFWGQTLLGLPGAEVRTLARATLLVQYDMASSWVRRSGEESLALLKEGLSIARESGHRPAIALALYAIGACQSLHEIVAARQRFEESLVLCRVWGLRDGEAMCLNQLGTLARRSGDLATAVALQEKALAIGHELGDDWVVADTLFHFNQTVEAMGDLARAQAITEESLRRLPRVPHATVRRPRAVGPTNPDGATVMVPSRSPRTAAYLVRLASLRQAQGDLAGARGYLDDWQTIRRATGLQRLVVPTLRQIADIARLQGELSPARAALEEALALAREMQDAPTVTAIEADLAALPHSATPNAASTPLPTSPRWGEEPGRAKEPLPPPAGEEPGRAKEPLPPPAGEGRVGGTPQATTSAGQLTGREREVAGLVAAGLSNREIASRLVVSTSTAKAHVEHIMNKLGLHTRVQIAAWVLEQRHVAQAEVGKLTPG